jgi:hypothetical protein
MVHRERGNAQSTALVYRAVANFLNEHGTAIMRSIIVSKPRHNVEVERLLQVGHERPGPGWTQNMKRDSWTTHKPTGEPQVRQSNHMIRVKMREKQRANRAQRNSDLIEPLQYATSRVEEEFPASRLD